VLSSKRHLPHFHQLLTIFDMPRLRAKACTIQNSVKDSVTERRSRWFASSPHRSTAHRAGRFQRHCPGAAGHRCVLNSAATRAAKVRQADVLGEKVIGAEPQSRYRVQFAVPRGEEDDGQLRRQRA